MTIEPQRRLRIKICGLTHEEHVAASAEAGADLVGFVLWPGSPRHLPLERAIELALRAKAAGLESVALVVDADPSALPASAPFDRVQCHGEESCPQLAAFGRPTIKGFAYTPGALRAWDACPHADWLLLDGPRGGSGAGFDQATLAGVAETIAKPWLLAGGLAVHNVADLVRRWHPFGVDVSSGVERVRGVKDPELIAAFCRAARSTAE